MKSNTSLAILLLVGVTVIFVDDLLSLFSVKHQDVTIAYEHRSLTSSKITLSNYTHDDIIAAAPFFHTWYLRLLRWDGDGWSTFAIGHNSTVLEPALKHSARLKNVIPMLTYSLETNFPGRFKKGSPHFEMMFSEADTLSFTCSNDSESGGCPTFPPILSFGSVMKDRAILPSVQMMPPPTRWFDCLYNWRIGKLQGACPLQEQISYDIEFKDLKPQIVWRGSDWHFLPNFLPFSAGLLEAMRRSKLQWQGENKAKLLSLLKSYSFDFPPRWKAALWTLEADEDTAHPAWIDSRFVGGCNNEFRGELMDRGLTVNGGRIEEKEMLSTYKYHVDFGGGGGTTWEGTIMKLLAPGLLFHHETPTKDFFYDDMIPWVHYVPIKADISDLRAKFEWAESHPEQAQHIAEQGRAFAERLLTTEYMAHLNQKLFVDYLGAVVDAYQAPSDLEPFPSDMIVHVVSSCYRGRCRTEVADQNVQTSDYRI